MSTANSLAAQVHGEPAGFGEWRNGWPVVLAGLFGFILLAVGSLSMGAFMAPVEAAHGWTRSEYSLGLSVYATVGVICSPLVGWLVSRLGVRRVAFAGSLLTGLTFALFATATASVAYWLFLWLLFGLANQLIMTTVWSTAVAGSFTFNRGTAFSVIMVGSGLAALIAPVAANYLIDQYDWRVAYAALGCGAGGLVALVCWFALASSDSATVRSASRKGSVPGIRKAFLSATFVRIALLSFISYGLLMVLSLHLIPVLTAASMNRDTAIVVAGSYGLPMIIGKLIGGAALDRFSGRLVLTICLSLLLISYALLALPVLTIDVAMLAVILFGLAFGGIAPGLPYLASRYFELSHFSRIFGTLNGFYSLATATCPLLASWVFDERGSYHAFLIGAIPVIVVAMGLAVSLGRYPDPSQPPSPESRP